MSRWRNWSGRLTCEPAALHFARSVEDIQALISGSAAAGHKIRPAGAGHSHSPIVLSDEVIVDFSGLSGVVEVTVRRPPGLELAHRFIRWVPNFMNTDWR